MKKLIATFTLLILLLSLAASLAGAFSYGHDDYRSFTTARNEMVQVQYAGIYRYSVHALVTSGIPWDFVRLFVGIPVFFISFTLYLRGSGRGTVVLIGCLASFLYQYLLWTFDWAYNSLFLVYVALFSLSLWTLAFVVVDIDRAQIQVAIKEHFSVRTMAVFSFAVGGLLFLKCLGEIMPSLRSGTMPTGATGYYTLVDQALDLGLLTPLCVLTGILLLKRNWLGYLMFSSSLIILLSVGLSVIAGEIMLGMSIGRVNIVGVAVFSLFVLVALTLLVRVLVNIKRMTLSPA